MKIRLEQLNPVAGDIEGNQSLITASLQKAEDAGIDLLILPEMVLTGYPVQDLLEKEYFRERCYRANETIVQSAGNTALLFGTITPNDDKPGRKMFNSALLVHQGKIIGQTHKSLLPTYDVFDDLRYFEPGTEFTCLSFQGVKLGVTICEDIWYNENEIQYHTYSEDPAKELKEKGAQVIINISASPYTARKHENRLNMLKNHAKKLGLPVLYSNQVGSHTDIIFDGDSVAISSGAEVIAKTEPFVTSHTDVEWNVKQDILKEIPRKTGINISEYPVSKEERQFKAIKLGLKDYLTKTGMAKDVVLGLSGGIDSALVAVLAVETLGAEHVKAVTMPGEFSSEGSVSDSEKLAENLGIELLELPIGELFNQYSAVLKPVFGDLPFGVAEENLQSRIRGTLLMAYSNKFGNFLLTTGNKSEYAVGYATLYGDMNGSLAIIGDLYKTEVYDLSQWMNTSYYKKEVIPGAILQKPPSAELRPGQKDSDSLPEYDVLDDILYRYLELQENADNIIKSGYNSEIVQKVIKMVDMNEFKRYQAAPVLKLSSKSFGTGRRWPVVQRWTSNELS
ncbi:MAG: NAD+ synthase [Balneolaceae bacterium]